MACPPCPETEKRLREVVASRRLSAAPLPWPYETHPRGGTFPPSATPVILVVDPATTSRRRGPCSFHERKRGCSWDFALSRPVHAPIRPISSLSLALLPLAHFFPSPPSSATPSVTLFPLCLCHSFVYSLSPRQAFHISSVSFSETPPSRRISPAILPLRRVC